MNISTINSHLESSLTSKVSFRRKSFTIHGISVNGVFPVFEGIEIRLPDYYMTDAFWAAHNNNDQVCYREQMRAASRQLHEMIKKNPKLANQYTTQQQSAIAEGKHQIPELTWHHKEDWLIMQLVDADLHKRYKHTGGSYTWNKKHFQK
ncbi:HNH endonuclease [Bacteroides sp. 224]|uniref:HNH endonuclease n=1 Tax=Bacteroides sp. 224 TaxID=2302936 RepID=UPI0013D0C684|nr:HNH endonuclease [Bacteroides sp. 224]NDV66340.1 hypothetical protein [Bacteroides sp. 224]